MKKYFAVMAVLLVAGCGSDTIYGVGFTGLNSMHIPAPYSGGGSGCGLDVSITGAPPTIGLSITDMGNGPLETYYIAGDLGYFSTYLGSEPKVWPVVKPMIGMWYWENSPEYHGLMTGVRVGLGVRLGEESSSEDALTIEYMWTWLNDFDGDEDAYVNSVRLAYVINLF